MKKTGFCSALFLSAAMTIQAQTWIDITNEFVINPNFDGNINGWTDAFGNASQNHGYQGAEYWSDDRQTHIHLFAEAWRSSESWAVNQLGNGSIYQELKNLPTGKFRLEADAIAVNQGKQQETATGVLLFILDGLTEGTTEMATGNGKPQHFAVEATTSQSNLTIGVRTRNTSANWIAIDNIKLFWYGTERPVTRIELNTSSATVRQGEQLKLTASVYPSNALFKDITFTSSNEQVATVDENGNVNALKPGIATITATSTKYTDISAKCVLTVKSNEVPLGAIIFNEIQQSNVDMFIDPTFNYGGWVELYNTTDEDVLLDGLYISDDIGNLKKMPLSNTRHGNLPANGFCTLWFDHFSWWTPKSINFKLDCDGGSLYISDGKGNIHAQLDYPPAITRTSYARTTDGGATWGYTDQPTPGESNTTSSFAATRLPAPIFNKEGGLFSTGFAVMVTNRPNGATLRYTTNGSTPTLTNGETSVDGRFTITSTTILRARFFQAGMLSSPVVTRTFIRKDRDFTLPVLSLVSDKKNLTGSDYGIFVRGNGNGRPGNGQSDNCNWNMDWDRPANIEFIDENGVAVFNQEVGIEPSGGWSRAFDPHSFNIKANKIYEGNNRMDYQFFKDKPFLRHRGLKIRNGGNDTSGRIKDAAIQQVVSTSGLYVEAQAYRPVHLYRNGQYIGILNLREPNNKNYAFANYGMDTDDDEMDLWKMSPDSGYVQQVGTRDVFDEWYTLSQNAADALVYERIKQIVDIEEMCNYMAVQLYLCGGDWPKNNIKCFRSRDDGTSNSRFRAILFDLDHAFSNGTNEFNWFFENSRVWNFDQLYGDLVIAKYGNRITKEIEFVTIMRNMLQNASFKKQLVDQFCIVAGSVFEPDRSYEIIQEMINRVAEDGFQANSGYDVISQLSSYRQASTVNNMRNYFNLEPSKTITLSSNVEEARLLINGLEVPTGKFSGQLFSPITVTAAAPAGYRFVGWRSASSAVGSSLFSRGSSWNYYDQGSLDGVDWTSSSYNATWPDGNAPLGYLVTDAANSRSYQTFLDYGGDDNNKYPTSYFRKTITLDTTPKSSENFTLNWIADDGFIIYVNGQEAGRYQMPSANISFNTFATTYAHDNPDAGTMTLDAALFKRGRNTIAVELHNNAANSTDIYWDAELIYNQVSHDDIVSTEADYEIPQNSSTLTLTAIYEQMPESDTDAWDVHPVKINEVSADNDVYVSDIFKKSDWIELYNTTHHDIDAAGMFLSDHLEEPEKWQIPSSDGSFSTIIPAHGHLVIWCDKTVSSTQLHADFKLNNADSCLVLLTAADKSWADTLVYCRHDGFHSVGLYPDGASQAYVMERPTIGKTNVLTTTTFAYIEPKIEPIVKPDAIDDPDMAENPFKLHFSNQMLSISGINTARVNIYDAAGRLMMTARLQSGKMLSLSSLPHGLYTATATSDDDITSLKFQIQTP